MIRRNCPIEGYECYTTGHQSRRKAATMIDQHVQDKHPEKVKESDR